MVVIYGTQLYGRVEQVPGLFHVATKFAHAWYVPLFPMQSYVVLAESGEQFSGIAIGHHIRSIVWAYVRAALVLYAVGSLGVAALRWLSGESFGGPFVAGTLLPLVVAAGCVALAVATRGLTRASRERALQIAERAGLDQNVVAAHFEIEGARAVARREAAERDKVADRLPAARAIRAPEPRRPAPAEPVIHAEPRSDEDFRAGPKLLT